MGRRSSRPCTKTTAVRAALSVLIVLLETTGGQAHTLPKGPQDAHRRAHHKPWLMWISAWSARVSPGSLLHCDSNKRADRWPFWKPGTVSAGAHSPSKARKASGSTGVA